MEIVEKFICPITHDVFRDPVIASDGHTYERCAIKKWLDNHDTSPLTREVLQKEYYSNTAMKQLIDIYMATADNDKIKLNLHSEECVDCILDDPQYIPYFNIDNWDEAMFQNFSEKVLRTLVNVVDFTKKKGDSGDYPIHLICKHAEPNIVKYAADVCCESILEIKDAMGRRALHLVCKHSSPDVVRHLVDKGVKLDVKDNKNKRPIHLLCKHQSEDTELIRYFINKTANLECRDHNNKRPLHYLCQHGCEESIKCLIERGVNTNCCDDFGCEPIHYAAEHNSFDSVKLLIDSGCHLESADNAGWTPIHYICRFKPGPAIRYVVDMVNNLEQPIVQGEQEEEEDEDDDDDESDDENKEYNMDGWRPIHLVCAYADHETIIHLINKGVDLEAETDEGLRPSHLVCRHQSGKTIELLMGLGVDLECEVRGKNGDYGCFAGYRPIHFVSLFQNDHVIKSVVDRGVDLEAKAANGWKPIHQVCSRGLAKSIKYLIGKGVLLGDIVDGESIFKMISMHEFSPDDKELIDNIQINLGKFISYFEE